MKTVTSCLSHESVYMSYEFGNLRGRGMPYFPLRDLEKVPS